MPAAHLCLKPPDLPRTRENLPGEAPTFGFLNEHTGDAPLKTRALKRGKGAGWHLGQRQPHPSPGVSCCPRGSARPGLCPMTNTQDCRAMDPPPPPPGPAAGPVTFSQVFGQQCQLMEAGKGGTCPGTPSASCSPRPACPFPLLSPNFFPKICVFPRENWGAPFCLCTPALATPEKLYAQLFTAIVLG